MWKINIDKRYRTGQIAAGNAGPGKRCLCTVMVCISLLCGCGQGGQEELIPLEEAAQSQTSQEEAMQQDTMQPDTKQSGTAQPESSPLQSEEGMQESGQDMIYVHVCGAVEEPGVVKLPLGSRAQDAVLAAGGFCEDADPDCVNLAAFLTDGEQLYIPTREETAAGYTGAFEGTKSSLINLNTADADMLCTLPGIGESRARDIIAYREQHGGFSSVEEIMQVSGIKESTYEKLKELITVK